MERANEDKEIFEEYLGILACSLIYFLSGFQQLRGSNG